MYADFIGWDLGKQITRTAFECSTVSEILPPPTKKFYTVETWKSQDKEDHFQDVIISHLLG